MSRWPSIKAKRLLSALLRIGWQVAWQSGSHRRLKQIMTYRPSGTLPISRP